MDKLLDVRDVDYFPKFICGNFFAVTKEAILRRSRDFYIKLARILGREENPDLCNFFERAWPQVFNSTCGKTETCTFGSIPAEEYKC